MMSITLLNIFHDIGNVAVDILEVVNKFRAEHPSTKLILWPVAYALTVFKVFFFMFGSTGYVFRHRDFPETIENITRHLMEATPYSVLYFNRAWVFLMAVDLYLYFFCESCFTSDLCASGFTYR